MMVEWISQEVDADDLTILTADPAATHLKTEGGAGQKLELDE